MAEKLTQALTVKMTEAQYKALHLRAEQKGTVPPTTKPKVQRQQRTAFDIPAGTTSAVTLAVKPRQAAYKAGPGIHVVGGAQGRRDAEMRRAMRMTKI